MLLILSPDVLLVVWQAALTMLSNSLMHWWLSFCDKGVLLSNSIVVCIVTRYASVEIVKVS